MKDVVVNIGKNGLHTKIALHVLTEAKIPFSAEVKNGNKVFTFKSDDADRAIQALTEWFNGLDTVLDKMTASMVKWLREDGNDDA